MFLADAVAGYVESLTERELDAPFLALLHRLGFAKVHLVHGPFELGKDFIAQRDEDGVRYQYCFQSKAGDIGGPGWRELRGQLHDIRTGTVVHPDFDPHLPRRIVVVTTGRLKGTAGVQFQDDNRFWVGRGEVPAELWDVDALVPELEAVLAEGVPLLERARVLEMLGRLGQGLGDRAALRALAKTWFAETSPKDRWANVLTAAMLAKEAAARGREDLACQAAFLLVRSEWEGRADDGPDLTRIDTAMRLFRAHAREFFDMARTLDPVQATTRTASGLDVFVTHPVKVARLCECVSLLGLDAWINADADTARDAADYVAGVVSACPAVAHPVSDEWAFSVLVTVLLLHVGGHDDVAAGLLRECAVWLLDKVEHGMGIAPAGASAEVVVHQLLGPAYPSMRIRQRPGLYAFAVVLDCAHLLGLDALYEDLVHDMDAVGGMASIVQPSVAGARFVARIEYAARAGASVASHHELAARDEAAGAAGDLFGCLTSWATTRDRHIPAVLRAIAEPETSQGSVAGRGG